MTKKFTEASPRSASAVAPQGAPPSGESPVVGLTMQLDDLPVDARSQHLEDSLERAQIVNTAAEEVPAAPAANAPASPAAHAHEPVAAAAGNATTPASAPPITETSPASAPPPKARPATKMIATPIDAELRLRVRDLRGRHEISEAFVVETALTEFFGSRPLEEIAADLRARGGRLRRNR